MRGSFAKIDLTGGANAFDVAPISCEIQIRFQNFEFRIMPLELESAHDLDKFAGWRSGLQMETRTRELHGTCRCSGARFAVRRSISGAQHSDRIHDAMS